MALGASVASPAIALAEADEPLQLRCIGEKAFDLDALAPKAKISFQTTVPFGEGKYVALSDPETGAVENLVYDLEASTGSFQIEDNPAELIVWTLATSCKAELVGQIIESDGQLLSLTIRGAASDSGERLFVLFATATASVYRGSCS